MKKSAIILGATGLTGGILLKKLIEDARYDAITLFSRTQIDNLPDKVTQFIGNIIELENFKEHFIADVVFCCIGTTAKKTPDKTRYRKIDYGIPVTAAKLSKEHNISTFIVVSAVGANANSPVFYNKTKGEMEDAVLLENIEKTYILQPSIIDGGRQEQRTAEKLALVVFKIIKPLFFGKFKKYRVTKAEDIAQAMINLANLEHKNDEIITSEKIEQLAKLN